MRYKVEKLNILYQDWKKLFRSDLNGCGYIVRYIESPQENYRQCVDNGFRIYSDLIHYVQCLFLGKEVFFFELMRKTGDFNVVEKSLGIWGSLKKQGYEFSVTTPEKYYAIGGDSYLFASAKLHLQELSEALRSNCGIVAIAAPDFVARLSDERFISLQELKNRLTHEAIVIEFNDDPEQQVIYFCTKNKVGIQKLKEMPYTFDMK